MFADASTSRRGRSRVDPARDGDRAGVIIALVLVLLLALTGGSSRPDAVQLVVLRPVIVIIGVVLLMMPSRDWRIIRPVFMLLGLFAATITLQLVPLPPFIWHSIPGHDPYNAVLDAIGAGSIWRPLTVSVDGTLNALAALTIPFVVLLAMTRLRPDIRPRALEVILLLGAVSMALGIAQMASSSTSVLYFYEVNANDQLVGLFANRNHQAAMLAMLLPLLRVWAILPNAKTIKGRARGGAALAAGTIVIAFVLVVGSRAGLVLVVVGLVGAFLVKPRFSNPRNWRRQQWLIAAGVVIALIAVFAIVALADRSAATDRIAMMQGLGEEGRVEVLPVLLRIVADVWPFGTGYGTFVPVFASYEPDAMLTPFYWNNAHNDPLEVLITGGVPGVLAVMAFMGWWVSSSYSVFTGRARTCSELLARGAVFATLILMLASLVDYPLRTPLLGAIFLVLCSFLAVGTKRTQDLALMSA